MITVKIKMPQRVPTGTVTEILEEVLGNLTGEDVSVYLKQVDDRTLEVDVRDTHGGDMTL